jgi:hypothetical protein
VLVSGEDAVIYWEDALTFSENVSASDDNEMTSSSYAKTFPPDGLASSGYGVTFQGDVFMASKNAGVFPEYACAAVKDVIAYSEDGLASSPVQKTAMLFSFPVFRLVKHYFKITGHFELRNVSPALILDAAFKLHSL